MFLSLSERSNQFKKAREILGWRYRTLRQNAIGGTARALAHFGIHNELPLTIQQQWERVINRSRNILANSPPASVPPVLFLTIWDGDSPILNALESVLAYSVRLRGVKAISLACGKTFPACVYDPLGNHVLPVPDEYEYKFRTITAIRCRYCVKRVRQYYSRPFVEQQFYQRYLESGDLEKAVRLVDSLSPDVYQDFVYRDIQVGEHAYSSTLRALGRGTLSDDPSHIWLLKHQLVAAIMITRLTERALAAIRPRRVMAVHGIYVDHGTACEVARKMGYPIVVYSVPYRKEAIMLCHGDTYHKALVEEAPTLWENLVLTENQRERLYDYIFSRQKGKHDSITYHPNPIEEKSAMIDALNLDTTKPIVSLFTNVIWDAQLYHDCAAFENILDWLFQTVEYFIERQDLQLVIRIHPAEVKASKKTEQPLAEELRSRFSWLPDNIKIIPPESDLSSYTLVNMSQAALIYGTKMGLEIALRGVPVIIAGESFNRGKGFSYDVASREEYFNLLDRIPDLPRNSAEMMQRAEKYGYHFYFRRQIDFPFVKGFIPGNHLSLKLGFDHLDDLLPGKNKYLDAICQGIIEGTEFVVD